MDRTIGKTVYKLEGFSSSSTCIIIPSNGKTLGLTGNYIYFECKRIMNEKFKIDITLKMSGSPFPLRITISNRYSFPEYKDPNTIIVPFDFINDKWTILTIHIPSIVKLYSTLNAKNDVSECIWKIKEIQICAALIVRGIYTSDILFDVNDDKSLPRDMQLPLRDKKPFSELYQFEYIPQMNESIINFI